NGGVVERPARGHAGRIHQAVAASKALFASLSDRANILLDGKVGSDKHDIATHALQLGDHLLTARRIAAGNHQPPRTLLRKMHRDALTDALRAAGDNDDFPVDFS